MEFPELSCQEIHFLHSNFLGHLWAHHCCAAWSEGVIQADDYSLQYVDKAVLEGYSQVKNMYNHMHSFSIYQE